MRKIRKVLGKGYFSLGTDYACGVCHGSEGDWIGLVDKYDNRIKFVDKFPTSIAVRKFKLIVECTTR